MQKPQVYETLSLLNDEISEGVRNLLSGDIRKEHINQEIDALREQSYRKSSAPEAEFALSLFRKYADIANNIKDQLRLQKLDNNNHDSNNNNTSLSRFEIPTYIYEGNREQLSGMKATKKNIFWYRTLVVLFSLAGYITIVTVRFVNYKHVDPMTLAGWSCSYFRDGTYTYGEFNMKPYFRAAIISAIVYVYSVFFMIYYCLPVDENDKKYIPGLAWLFDTGDANEIVRPITGVLRGITTSVSDFAKENSKFVEALVDVLLFAALVVISSVASVSLNSSQRFVFHSYGTYNPNWISSSDATEFFTLDSFYATMNYQNPPCMTQNPCDALRSGLVLLYFAALAMALTMQVSVRSFISANKEDAPSADLEMDSIGSNVDSNPIVGSPVYDPSYPRQAIAPPSPIGLHGSIGQEEDISL